MINVKFYNALDFDKLHKYWSLLENGKDMTAFQSYSWYKLLNEQYLNKGILIPGECVYAVCFIDNIAKMIAPLYIVKLPAFFQKFHIDSGAYILGKWGYTDYLNIIYSDFSEQCLEKIMQEVKIKYNVTTFNFHQILPETSMVKYLKQKYSNMLLFDGDCAKIPVKASFDDYYNALSKNVRQNLRTAQNRANKDNIDIHYEIMNNVSDEDANILCDIYCERQQIKNSSSGGLVNNIIEEYSAHKKKNYNFLIEMIKNAENGFVLGCYSDDKLIGMVCGAEDEYAIRIPVVCFKNDYARYSPCMLCIFNFLKDSYENKTIKTFDLLKGTEQYKFNLGGEKFSIQYYKIEL